MMYVYMHLAWARAQVHHVTTKASDPKEEKQARRWVFPITLVTYRR